MIGWWRGGRCASAASPGEGWKGRNGDESTPKTRTLSSGIMFLPFKMHSNKCDQWIGMFMILYIKIIEGSVYRKHQWNERKHTMRPKAGKFTQQSEETRKSRAGERSHLSPVNRAGIRKSQIFPWKGNWWPDEMFPVIQDSAPVCHTG